MRTFAGIGQEYGQYDRAQIVIIPVPFDGTSTWVKGADKGPDALLQAAENMELYDIETNSEVYKKGIHLASPIEISSSPEDVRDAVFDRVSTEIKSGKFAVLLGGEHSVSIGSIQAHAEHYRQLTVLQIDAHADLREEYEGSTCNHACALHWASKHTNLVQVGIRSMDVSELQWMNKQQTFFAQDLAGRNDWIDEVLSCCKGPVYLTIDLDGLDPSIMPATGTPEPGGLGWYEVLRLLKRVIETNTLVGMDIVELCPIEGDKSSDFLAAKLLYKLLSYRFK